MLFVYPSEDGATADVWPVERTLELDDWARAQIMATIKVKERMAKPGKQRRS